MKVLHALTSLFLLSVLVARGFADEGQPCIQAALSSLARWSNPMHCWRQAHVAAANSPEIVQMIVAMARGKMGPGEGWFHSGESRYDWDWLASRLDADKDGSISKDEFAGSDSDGAKKWFAVLDRNGDGTIKAEDLDWSDKSDFSRESAQAGRIARAADSSSNGRISPAEWQEFYERVAQGKNYVTPEDLRRALFPPPPPPDSKKEDPSPLVLLRGLFNGEIGSYREGPEVGQQAPLFTLSTHDGKQQHSLNEFRGWPVVVIFGSFT